MIPPDVALVQLINRTAIAYVQNAPDYITYREHTHVVASIGQVREINRFVQVRQADNFAVMQDLPQGAQRTGQAFPIIPYFDPLGQNFNFSWFANLKRVDITLGRSEIVTWQLPPADPSVSLVLPYISFLAPAYMPDSTEQRLHFRILPTPANGINLYIYDVLEDEHTHLPSHIEIRDPKTGDRIMLDYQVLQGHWVITRGTLFSTQHYGPLTFLLSAQTDYEDMAFPATAPDPRLAGTPTPSPAPTPTPTP